MFSINSARTLLRKNEEDTLAVYQKEYADMIREKRKEEYDNVSLAIALESLKISKWNLFFVVITLLLTLYSILTRF